MAINSAHQRPPVRDLRSVARRTANEAPSAAASTLPLHGVLRPLCLAPISLIYLAPRPGLEPGTYGLTVRPAHRALTRTNAGFALFRCLIFPPSFAKVRPGSSQFGGRISDSSGGLGCVPQTRFERVGHSVLPGHCWTLNHAGRGFTTATPQSSKSSQFDAQIAPVALGSRLATSAGPSALGRFDRDGECLVPPTRAEVQ